MFFFLVLCLVLRLPTWLEACVPRVKLVDQALRGALAQVGLTGTPGLGVVTCGMPPSHGSDGRALTDGYGALGKGPVGAVHLAGGGWSGIGS